VSETVPRGRAAIILAGGRGTRLGEGPPKALRPLAGATLLERALERACAWAGEVWVSAPPSMALPAGAFRVVRDHAAFGPSAGPLVALASALGAVESPWALVMAVDLPLARPELPDLLWSLRDHPSTPAAGVPHHAPAMAVVPWTARGPEPLLALYRKEVGPVLLAAAYSGERAVHRAIAALPAVRVSESELRAVDPDLRSFFNLNTPADWARAETQLGSARRSVSE
jgi:molybdopterin-guanine dinucleotide biosynthesis protein A